MQEKNVEKPKLNELITSQTTPDEVERIVARMLTEGTKQVLGNSAPRKIVEAVFSITAFAPEPATFDDKALEMVVGWDDSGNSLPPEQTAALMKCCKEMGVVEERAGRFYIARLLHANLKAILSK